MFVVRNNSHGKKQVYVLNAEPKLNRVHGVLSMPKCNENRHDGNWLGLNSRYLITTAMNVPVVARQNPLFSQSIILTGSKTKKTINIVVRLGAADQPNGIGLSLSRDSQRIFNSFVGIVMPRNISMANAHTKLRKNVGSITDKILETQAVHDETM